jgi:hypothetical protein
MLISEIKFYLVIRAKNSWKKPVTILFHYTYEYKIYLEKKQVFITFHIENNGLII